MKRIAAAAATFALGVTLNTGIAQAQEPGRYGTALRPVAPSSIAARDDNRAWKDSRRDDRGIARSQRERVRERNEDRDRVYDRDGRYEDDRSWGKSAIIVGGSAATGAGIGGILGGAKGALIGAAIGGGGAAIYEGTKQK